MAFNISRLFFNFLIWFFLLICLSSGFPNNKESILSSKGEQEFGIFQQWMKDHGKKYPNSKTTETRYQIFRKNLNYIRETNAKRYGYRLALNKFADMTHEEFKRVFLRQLPAPTTTTNHPTVRSCEQQDNCAPPDSVDWREKGVVTPVKHQKKCGSCWAFATIGAIESINAISRGELVSLSEQELVDCDSLSYGCSGGYIKRAFEWVIENGGITEEAYYPYLAQKDTCKVNMNKGGKVVKIKSYGQVAQSEEGLLCATAQQPITVALDANYLQFYHDGIYDGGNCDKYSNYINHAVLIVGYGSKNEKDYWIVKNSWGENWGINGYLLIERNTSWPNGVCAINTLAYYPTI